VLFSLLVVFFVTVLFTVIIPVREGRGALSQGTRTRTSTIPVRYVYFIITSDKKTTRHLDGPETKLETNMTAAPIASPKPSCHAQQVKGRARHASAELEEKHRQVEFLHLMK